MKRFIEAHNRDFRTALAEVKNGRKQTHWMWYIFPQVAGLGKSDKSAFYAIRTLSEARAFLADSTLGANLKEICEALLSLDGIQAERIFGRGDATKLCSSMTLFDAVAPDSIFGKVLEKYFDNKRDAKTLDYLSPYRQVTAALDFIGVDTKDFNITRQMYIHRSNNPMHLFSHLYRVMIGCALIARKLNQPRLGLLAFIGGFIHDLARLNDGDDHQHGRRAATEILPKLTHILAKYDITDEELDIIAKAVTYHNEHIDMRLSNQCYITAKILKDADALDRCRFRNSEASLKTRYLKYKVSHECIDTIEYICKQSRRKNCIHDEVPFKDFVEATII